MIEKKKINKKESILVKSIMQTALGLLIFGLLLLVLWLLVLFFGKIGIIFPIDKDNLNVVLTIIATIGTTMYILNFTKFEKKQEERKRQLDLLGILYEELGFLSGNLKSYAESFSKQNHYPLYELWRIDTSLYFFNFESKINDRGTIKLKKNLMKIKDKVILVNNFKSEIINLETRRANEKLIKKLRPSEIIRKQIIEMINKEILPLVKNSQKIIKSITNP